MCCSIIIQFDSVSNYKFLKMFFFLQFFCVTLEFNPIQKSDEESHEEEPLFIQNDAVSRKQGKHSTRDMNMYFFLV